MKVCVKGKNCQKCLWLTNEKSQKKVWGNSVINHNVCATLSDYSNYEKHPTFLNSTHAQAPTQFEKLFLPIGGVKMFCYLSLACLW